LGSTGLRVSAVTLGTSGLGNTEKVTDAQADAVISAVLRSPITVIDTGNNYGVSEQRIGQALGRHGGVPTGTLLVTKVDPLRGNADFSGSRVRESLRESLDRLGVEKLRLVHFHDPERITFADAMSPDGPVRALLQLQEQGLIEHLGVAGGPVRLLEDYVRTGHFGVVLTHNRFTLVDRSADSLLDLAAERNIGVFNAAPYGGGFLTSPSHVDYCYRPATRQQLDARLAMIARCAAYGIDLPTAALHFSLTDERIASTVVGVSGLGQLEQTMARLAVDVPAELMRELAQLTPGPGSWFGPDRA
jgi:D-threo-aldose 1-dehydrogenase